MLRASNLRRRRNFKTTPSSCLITSLNAYAKILGRLLAKWHARTSAASMIAGYAGASTRLDTAMKQFARTYADQVEADYEQFVRAVSRGL